MKRGIDIINALLRPVARAQAEERIEELAQLLGEDALWFEYARGAYRALDSRTMAALLVEAFDDGQATSTSS